MIIKHKKSSIFFLIGVVIIVILSFSATSKNYFFSILKEDLIQLVMSTDPGFSHQSFLLESELGKLQQCENISTKPHWDLKMEWMECD